MFRLLLSTLAALHIAAGVAVSATPPKPAALVLYDSSGATPWVGALHAKMLANLLGHFQMAYDIQPIEHYRTGRIQNHYATFYFGNAFNNPLPRSFLQDALSATNRVCWFKYNLWQLSSAPAYSNQFRTAFGFQFNFMDDSAVRAVRYKGEEFTKNPAEIELGRTTILNPQKSRAVAMAGIPGGVDSFPYIVNSSNFWYVADSPFSYLNEEDRYLVFCDVLHDILKMDHPEIHRALVRLEDVDATSSPEDLRGAADLLRSQGVPFGVSVIPMHEDPYGVYNGGAPRTLRLSESPWLIDTLRYVVAQQGQLLVHGYTHQYLSLPNPHTAVSGDDYEFFRVTLSGENQLADYHPVPEDSTSWAQARVKAALNEFNTAGLAQHGWVTPHYAASALDYGVFAQTFTQTIQRVLYADEAGHYAGQFFPYPIVSDTYGQNIIPENLGHVDPVGWREYPRRLPADVLRAARKALVVRDGWASSFFHPFLDPALLREVVLGVQALGYRYIAPSDALAPAFGKASNELAALPGSNLTLSLAVAGPAPLSFQWRRSGIAIAGATNATLRVTNVWESSTYTLNARNAYGASIADLHLRVAGSPCSLTRAAEGITLSFPTQSPYKYFIEHSPTLGQTNWTIWTNLTGNGAVRIITDSAARSARYYRVRITP